MAKVVEENNPVKTNDKINPDNNRSWINSICFVGPFPTLLRMGITWKTNSNSYVIYEVI